MRSLILSLQFMTRLPIPVSVEFNRQNIKGAIVCFPLVGVILGIIMIGISKLSMFFPNQMMGFILVAAYFFLTGGLHFDGVGDTFDAFFSARDREKMNEILKDSRVGVFGVVGISMVLIGKTLLYQFFCDHPTQILLALTISRTICSVGLVTQKPARTEGIGYLFYDSRPGKLIFLIPMILCSYLFLYLKAEFFALLGTVLFSVLIYHRAKKLLGGISGDINGLVIEFGEILFLICIMGIKQWN